MTIFYGAAAVGKSLGITGASDVFNNLTTMIDSWYPNVNAQLPFRAQDGFSGT